MTHFCSTANLLLCLLLLSVAVGAVDNHMLLPNQTLVNGKTLVSQNQDFEMGFFSPGKSSNRFLGIWFKNTPEVVVWVANRNNPIPHSQAPVFAVSGDGSLVITGGESIIWLVNSSRVATNPVLHLLDSGNMVLVDDNNDNESTTYIWQSFDYPTDTLLPGMTLADDVEAGVERYLTSWRNPDDPLPGDFVYKIQNRGLAEVVTMRGGRKKNRVHQWNGMHFSIPIYKVDLVFKQERLISIGIPYPSSIVTRITLHATGVLHRHTMNLRKSKWSLAFSFPHDSCDEYASCGPNSICRPDMLIRCQCYKGFVPKFQGDWDLQDWSGGCVRARPLNCEGGDGFVEVKWVKYPDMLSFLLNTSISLEECRDECLRNCNCNAYANPLITNGGSGCLMWTGDLIDARELPVMKMTKIARATNKFSKENMIGVGGFGLVYLHMHKQGKMPSGEEIAVKRLSRSSRQGIEEFRNEVMVIAKLQHRNLVRLLGCCVEDDDRILIYEYLENKSLDYFVFNRNRRTLLAWPKRYDIIMGIEKGLLYLHHDSRLKIIHRDLKTSNILLDRNLIPKISDFGLARIFEEDQTLARTKRVIGTFGYMAPEYAIDGKFSMKSDIFSFGVVLLEIISGKKNRGYEDSDHHLNLLGHAWMLWKEGKILELMDECLNATFVESQVKRCMHVGLLCVQKFAEDRPTMSSVVSMLGSDGASLPEPKEPGFFTGRRCSNVRSSTEESDNGTITITDLEAR